jgi:hypothetical protein
MDLNKFKDQFQSVARHHSTSDVVVIELTMTGRDGPGLVGLRIDGISEDEGVVLIQATLPD